MIVRGTGYVKGGLDLAAKRLDGHLHYLQYRPRSVNETSASRSLFTRDTDRLVKSEARHLIEAHSCPRVRFHRLFVSPAAAEPVPDPRSHVRAVMADLENRIGKRLYWVAVHHSNTDHPHTHVVVAGMGTNLTTGKEQMIRLSVEDYAFLRETATKHSSAANWQQQPSRSSGLLTLPLLLPGELQVGTYRELTSPSLSKKGDQLTPHHVPSAEYMNKFGITRKEGVCLMMEHPTGGGGRHRETRSYGVSPDLSETPREALARDIRNARTVYRAAGLYNEAARDALREMIYLNKVMFPHLF